jgi:hypothetical protein
MVLVVAACSAAAPADGKDDSPVELEVLATIDVPGRSCEIIAFSDSQKLLLSTNSIWRTLDVFEVGSLAPPKLTPLSYRPTEGYVGGFWTVGEPTSVAVHPTRPIALVTALSREANRRGRLLGFDLRPGRRGRLVVDQAVGIHPDSLAISPDGRWAVIACEAEENPDTPGSIWAVDLEALTADRAAGGAALPAWPMGGLAELARAPLGQVEPEFVAFDPKSRLAVVTCQENDLAVLVDLQGGRPRLAGSLPLPPGHAPDGAAVLDQVADASGRPGCLIALAEEGSEGPAGGRRGQSLALLWVDPNDLSGGRLVARVDVPTLIDPKKPDKRRDPEGVVLFRLAGRSYAAVGVERGDRLICLDVTEPSRPWPAGMVRVGDRPEGIIAVPHGRDVLVITGDEGDGGPGTITFSRVRPTGQ